MDVTSPVSVRTVSLACTDATKGMSLHENQKRLRFYQNLVLPAFFCWCGKFTRRFCLLTGAQHSRLHPQSVLWLLIPKIPFVVRSQCPTTGNYNTAPPLVIQGGKATPSPTLRPIYTPQPTPFIPNPNYNGFTSGTVYTPRPTPAILIPGRPYPSGTPYPGGTYPPGTVPTVPPVTYTLYPGATYPVNYMPNPSMIPTFRPGQTYPTNMTPYPSGTYPTRVTYPLPTIYPGGETYPPGFSPVTTQVPYSPVVVYFTNAPLIPCGTYPPRQTPFVGGTYPTGTVPPRTYTPFVGGTYPPSQTFGPYFTQPTFRPYQTYPTNKTPYVGGT